jgi:hypothetical protein
MEEIIMKKFNKGMVITGTIAAAIAAMTFTGCGKGTTEITKSESPKTVQAAANNAASENVTKSAEVTAEAKKEETKTTTKKDSKNTDKKTETKKKSSKKTEKTEAKGANATANVTVQPTVVVPQQNTQQAQDAKQTKAAETKAPVVIPDEVYPVWVEGDMYAGTYAEEIAGRGTMEITRNSDGTYSVQVDWSSSAFEKCSWTFSGEFDGRAVMHYDNCCKTTVAFDENGNYTCDSYGYMTPYNNYTNGSGYIEFKDEGVLEWHSDMGDILPETTFVSCKQPYNTKADEVGTAGSNYYANERAWEATGDFYEVSGKRLRLEISESNMGSGLYDVTVIASGSAFECETYGFLAHYENDALVYDRGARSYQCYDSNGNIVENTIIDEGHSGTITYTGAAGLRWTDSDGSNYVFMEDITCA